MNRGIGMLSMDGKKLLHLIRLFLIVGVAGLIFFPMGWFMAKKHYEQQVLADVRSGTNPVPTLKEWQKSVGDSVVKEPMYLTGLALRLNEKKDHEGVKQYLLRLAELLGK